MLEDFKCRNLPCKYVPKPGDNIYICSGCTIGKHFRCEKCFREIQNCHEHDSKVSMLKFDPILTKLVWEHFTPPCNEDSEEKLRAEREAFEKSSQQEHQVNLKQAKEKHAQEIKTVVDKLNTQISNVNKLKTLGRNLKEKNEKYEKEVGEKTNEIEKLKEELKKAQESLAQKISAPCNKGQKREYFCSNSNKGCQEEFLTLKAHEKSCIFQEVPCPSVICKEVVTLKDVNDHMEQSHKMLKVNKEWNFEGAQKELNEIICCLSSYDQKFFPQVNVVDENLYFKVIMLGHQDNVIPFDVNMTFFLEDGKNILMKDRVYPVTENDKENNFLKVSLEKITQYYDAKSMELKCQPKIDFCLKIVNEKMDEIAKAKNENVESGMY